MLCVGTWGFFVFTWRDADRASERPEAGRVLGCALLLITTGRAVARARLQATDAYVQNTIVLGAGRLGQRVAQKFLQHPEYGVQRRRRSSTTHPPVEARLRPQQLPVLGTTQNLPELTRQLQVERVVFAAPGASRRKTIETRAERSTRQAFTSTSSRTCSRSSTPRQRSIRPKGSR